MPYVNIKITREGATTAQKAELIKRVTELLVKVLGKDPATTVVVINRDGQLGDWRGECDGAAGADEGFHNI